MIMRSLRKKLISIILLSAGLIAILAVILTLTIGEWVRELFVKPFLLLILLVQLYLASLPQLLLWLIFVAVLLIAAFFSVRKLGTKPCHQKIAVESKEKGKKMGPVEELAWRIEWASRSEYFERKIQQRLTDLAVELISREEGLPQEQARKWLKEGSWPQKEQEEIRRFFAKDLKGRSLPLWEYLKAYLRPARAGQFQRELTAVLEFLEGRFKHI